MGFCGALSPGMEMYIWVCVLGCIFSSESHTEYLGGCLHQPDVLNRKTISQMSLQAISDNNPAEESSEPNL